jgi:predicted transcriptional regulator
MNDMATVLATEEVDQVRDLIRKHIDDSGESVTELSTRADVPRDFLYRFLSGSYKYAPSFEYICRIVRAIGYKMTPEKI